MIVNHISAANLVKKNDIYKFKAYFSNFLTYMPIFYSLVLFYWI